MIKGLETRKVGSFFARCLYKFLVDGTLKGFGVIVESTVKRLKSPYYLTGLTFSMQNGICFLIGKFEINM